MPNGQKKVFLETNTQVIKIYGSKRQKEILFPLLEGNILYTSLFVFREFQNVIINTFVGYYNYINYLKDVKEANLEYTFDNSFNRRYKTLFTSLAGEFEKFSNYKKAMAELELQISIAIKEFYKNIDFIINNVKCPAVNVNFLLGEKNVEEYFQNTQCTAFCCLCHYYQIKKSTLRNAVDNIKSINYKNIPTEKKKEFEKLITIYNEILIDINNVNKYKYNLGDTTIGLECPKTATLLTYDNIFLIFKQIFNLDIVLVPQPERLSKEMAKTNIPENR